MEVGIIPIIPAVFGFLLPITAIITKKRKIIYAYTLIATTLTFLASLKLVELAFNSEKPLVYAFGNWMAPIGIVLEVDRVSSLLVLTTASLFLLTTIYSIRYLEHDHGIEYYFTAFLGLEAGVLGAFMTGDAFNLFIMLEVIGASSYSLVSFYRNRGESIEATFKYAIIGAIGTSMYFLALGIAYSAFGTLNMADLSAKLHGINFPITDGSIGDVASAASIFLALSLFAFMVKAAIFPTHFWLPDAHPAAPSPISALLSGVVVAVGAYATARYLYTILWDLPFAILFKVSTVLLVLGTISALLGSFMMLIQRDLKRLIAYSTIMHMGYLFMAIGVLNELGLIATIYHIINHAIGKTLLFLSAGAFMHYAHSRDLEDLAGIGKKMPIATFAFVISTLALVGVPPLNVFFSKMLIYDALIQRSFFLGSVIIFTSALAAWAYIKAVATLWRGEPKREIEAEDNPEMSIVMLTLTLVVVIVGILSPIILDKYIIPSAEQAMDYKLYINAVLEYARAYFSTF
ncbi:cation:proton antiporter [Thermococcus sp. M39]|uniref:proton-conducting transporter transmembrane domain-containing protein n=1 Tax=Thermococcus sp. M39 TaxID=1638262 RepID=UPI00143C92BC|nr:proton-conducting transporter membrane subunit [Thermococcus sp. M39]NJE07658.1 cation:proton antiporter [Thermococcus sp. M39]